jgi:hypothetical protein
MTKNISKMIDPMIKLCDVLQHNKVVGVGHSLLAFCHAAHNTNTVYNTLQSYKNNNSPFIECKVKREK